MTARAARRRAWRTGRWAETLCAWILRLKGYHILARDRRDPVGEIDLLARRGRVVAAVEVKARRDLATAAEALGPRQRKRIARAAEAFLRARSDLAGCRLRFDVMLVARGRFPRHIMDAWRPEA